MKKEFFINGMDKDAYLSKAAVWMDVIRNGVSEGEEDRDKVLELNEEEKKELIDYVYTFMHREIVFVARRLVMYKGLISMLDDCVNELALIVFENFHKFNNKRYKDCNFRFSTFVNVYGNAMVERCYRDRNNLSKRTSENKRLVGKAINFVSMQYGTSENLITTKDIYEAIEEITGENLSYKCIEFYRNSFNGDINIDDVAECLLATNDDIFNFVDANIVEKIDGFLSELRPLQLMIFLQHHEYCPTPYCDMRLVTLSRDKRFISLCENDKIAKKHIETVKDGDSTYKRVDVKFIKNARALIDGKFIDLIRSLNCDVDDLRGNLDEIMLKYWKKLL